MQPKQQQQAQQQQAQQHAQQQQMQQFLASIQQQQQLQAQRQQGQRGGQGQSGNANEEQLAMQQLLHQQLQLQQAQQLAAAQQAQAAHHQQIQQQGSQGNSNAQNVNPGNAAAMHWIQQMQLQQLAAQVNNHPEGMNWLQQLQLQQQQQQQQHLHMLMQLQQQQQQQPSTQGQQTDYQRATEQMQQRRLLEQQRQLHQQQQQASQGRRGKSEHGGRKSQAKKSTSEKGSSSQANNILKQQKQHAIQQHAMQQHAMQQQAMQHQQKMEQQLLQAQAQQYRQMAQAAAHAQQANQQKSGFPFQDQRESSGQKNSKNILPSYGSAVPSKKPHLKNEPPKSSHLESESKKRKNGERKEVKPVKLEIKRPDQSQREASSKTSVKSLSATSLRTESSKEKPEDKEKKKRRLEPQVLPEKASVVTQVKNEAYENSKITVSIGNLEVGETVKECLYNLEKTPRCRVVDLNDEESLVHLLKDNAEIAKGKLQNWVRLPQAKWIKDMMSELNEEALNKIYEKHRNLQTHFYTTGETDQRWESLTAFTETILAHWFEGKSLDDVIKAAGDLGQMELEGGVIIKGNIVEKALSRGSVPVDTNGLLDQLKIILSKGENGISVYSLNSKNFFALGSTKHVKDPKDLEVEIKNAIQEDRGIGSLNTTFDYSTGGDLPASGVTALDSYFNALDEFSYVLSNEGIELNKRLYLIWKLQNYLTTYHQDNHIFPHITIYQQTSGYSVFHFLPAIIGLYITHVSKNKSVEEVSKLLKKLDDETIGSYGIIGPGDAAIIFPFASHGVYVPSVKHNSQLSSFEISQVRAAEFVLEGIKEQLEKDILEKEDWNTVLPDREMDKRILESTEEGLNSLREKLSLSSEDFQWAINRIWGKWHTRAPAD